MKCSIAIAIVLGMLLSGCLAEKDKTQEAGTPPSDKVGIDYAEEKDPVLLFIKLDQNLKKWQEARRKGEHHFIMALERELERLSQGNLTNLVNALKTDQVDNKIIAAAALGFSADIRAVAPLLQVLEDDDEFVRANAAMSLGQLGFKEIPLAPLARCMLKDDSTSVRSMAAFAISKVVKVSADKSVFPALIKALQDQHAGVRNHAVIALGEMRVPEGAKPILSYTLQDDHPLVRINSAIALGKIRNKEAIGPLIARLRDEHPQVRVAAHWALQQITEEDLGDDPAKWEQSFGDQ